MSREDGISWREAWAMDDNASNQKRQEARALDTDSTWEELVNSALFDFQAYTPIGYLDPTSLRYYLAPLMITNLNHCKDCLQSIIPRLLTGETDQREPDEEHIKWNWRFPFRHVSLIAARRPQGELLTPGQKECLTEYGAINDEARKWGYDHYLTGSAPQ